MSIGRLWGRYGAATRCPYGDPSNDHVSLKPRPLPKASSPPKPRPLGSAPPSPTVTCPVFHILSSKPRPFLKPRPFSFATPTNQSPAHLVKAPPILHRHFLSPKPRPLPRSRVIQTTRPPPSPAPSASLRSPLTAKLNTSPAPWYAPPIPEAPPPPTVTSCRRIPLSPNPRPFPKPRPRTVGDESPRPQAPPIPYRPALFPITCHTSPAPRSVGIKTPPFNGHVKHKPRPPNPRPFQKPRPPTVGDKSPRPQAPPTPYRPALFPITCHTSPAT